MKFWQGYHNKMVIKRIPRLPRINAGLLREMQEDRRNFQKRMPKVRKIRKKKR